MELVTRPDLNVLAKQVHTNAVRHGFWQGSPSTEHCLCLVMCELAELVEAHRKGEKADRCGFSAMLCNWTDAEKLQDPEQWAYEFETAFRYHIKDTQEDEMADVVIRLLDLAAAKGKRLYSAAETAQLRLNSWNNSLTEYVYNVIDGIIRTNYSLQETINGVIACMVQLADEWDVDLWWHVLMKMQYNSSRPFMHGKKY